MILQISAKDIKITNDIRDFIDKKFAWFERYFNDDTIARMRIRKERYNYIIEVSIPIEKGAVLRAEVKGKELRTVIERAIDKLQGQLRRHKTSIQRYYNKSKQHNFDLIEPIKDEEEEETDIVKFKKFAVLPMSPEEAILQMDLLGHNFFVFLDADTENVNIVYKRDDGKYGLIEPVH